MHATPDCYIMWKLTIFLNISFCTGIVVRVLGAIFLTEQQRRAQRDLRPGCRIFTDIQCLVEVPGVFTDLP